MSVKIWTGAVDADIDTHGNYDPTNKFIAGDTLIFNQRALRSVTGENEAAITLAWLKQYMNMSSSLSVGTPSNPLIVGATKVDIGLTPEDNSSGSGAEIHLSQSNIQTDLTVWNTKSAGTSGLAPFTWKGTHASNKVRVYNGTVGIAGGAPADAATISELTVEGGYVTCASGTTLTNVYVRGGTVVLNSAVTNLYVFGGTVYVFGTGKVTNLFTNGGTARLSNRPASGNVVDVWTANGGTLDMSDNSATFAIGSTLVKDGGGTLVLATPTQGTFTGGFTDSFTKSTQITFSLR